MASGFMPNPLESIGPGSATDFNNAFRDVNDAPWAWQNLFNWGGSGQEGGGALGGMPSWGNVGSIFQGIGSGLQGYAALKGLGLAEDQFDFSKDAFNANYLAQAKNYNQQLHGRQRSEYLSSGRAGQSNNAYEHPDEKLSRWGVSEKKIG